VHLVRSASIPFVPASHEEQHHPGVFKKVLCDKTILQRGQVQMINWAKLPAESSFRLHYHEDMQEIFVMVRGKVLIRVENEEAVLEPQDAVIIPPGAEHQMKNLTSSDAEYVVVGIASGQGGKTVTCV